MDIIFDNIIFSLQKAGGISVVWYELLKRALKDESLILEFIESFNSNIFRKDLVIPDHKILTSLNSNLPLILQRYYNPKRIKSPGIFHSSYYRVAKGSNIKNVTTVHDFTYEYYRKGLPKKIHSIQKYHAIQKSERIICVSNNTKYDLIKLYPEIDQTKIKVVYNGVDNAYQILPDNTIQNLKALISFQSKEYILFVGDRLSSYKNFKVVAETCKKTACPIVIVGGGKITHEEKKYLDSMNVAYNHLSGINNSKLNILYNHALCLLYPSLYEGFGIPVIEAQRAGCPVIAANFSSIPEVIGPVDTLLSEPSVERISELINQLKNNTVFAATQIKIGLSNSKRFSWDKSYNETKKVYKEIYEEYF